LERVFTIQAKTAISHAPPIAIGSRFKMSARGAARCPRLANREGIIVGRSRFNSSIRVLFDGSKSPTTLHRDYIEQIPGANAATQ
jgi:hypothetical protein